MSTSESEPIIYPPAFAERVVQAWATLEDQSSELPSVNCVAKLLDVLYQASFLHGRFDGAPLPSHFVVHILAAGHLLTACGYRRLLELSGGRVLKVGFDPFKSTWLPMHFRPVREWLQQRLLETRLEGANVEDCFIRMMAQSVVRRILSLVRGRGHGGMLIYLPHENQNLEALSRSLRVRCPFESRLSTAHFSELC